MSSPKGRSKQENALEMQRLKTMYDRLPRDKQAAQYDHFQKRLNELSEAMNGKAKGKNGGGMGTMQTVLLVVIAAVIAVSAGFFGVTYLAQG